MALTIKNTFVIRIEQVTKVFQYPTFQSMRSLRYLPNWMMIVFSDGVATEIKKGTESGQDGVVLYHIDT